MSKTLRIGPLAAHTGLSIDTIRWYEAQGLIPGVSRDGGARRVYTERHLGWLELMQRLRRTGMSIARMRAYTALVRQGSATLKQRRELLAEHRAQVRQTIAEWTAALRLIDSKVDFYGEWLATGQRPGLDPVRRAGVMPDQAPAAPPARKPASRRAAS